MTRVRIPTSLVLGGALAAALAAASPRPAYAGPPWIAIELPANPYDQTSRGAFLLVHAFHHGTPVAFPVSGTAEGIVNGQRKSVKLEFERTSRPGVYALRNQWGTEGEWTLVISLSPGENAVAQAMVQVNAAGEVFSVRVPTRQQGDWTIPRPVTTAEIDASLRNRPVVAASAAKQR